MITVLGASGFIGSHLVKRLDALGSEYQAAGRDETVPRGRLGHVIYCIGVTADFRSRPFDTVEAHVCKLIEILRDCDFESLLYLSSTRLYTGADATNEETAIRIAPLDPSDLYNASKVMGESLILNCGRRRTRVARISNVYGDDFNSSNFLSSIIRDAIVQKRIVLQTSVDYAKDYISVDKVTEILLAIATSGKERIYNLASGFNVSNGQLADALRAVTGCTVESSQQSPVTFPTININRVRTEFDFQPSHVLDDIPHLVDLYRRNLESSHDQG